MVQRCEGDGYPAKRTSAGPSPSTSGSIARSSILAGARRQAIQSQQVLGPASPATEDRSQDIRGWARQHTRPSPAASPQLSPPPLRISVSVPADSPRPPPFSCVQVRTTRPSPPGEARRRASAGCEQNPHTPHYQTPLHSRFSCLSSTPLLTQEGKEREREAKRLASPPAPPPLPVSPSLALSLLPPPPRPLLFHHRPSVQFSSSLSSNY